jgi:hypothetical protein
MLTASLEITDNSKDENIIFHGCHVGTVNEMKLETL